MVRSNIVSKHLYLTDSFIFLVEGVDVDTGFMVYNTLNYPNLCSFFEELGLEGEPTTMGFSVSMDNGNLEWCSDSLSGILATPSNAYDKRIYNMFNDVFRFNQEATRVLSLPEDHPMRAMAVRDFLSEFNLSDAFRDYYLIPMTAAIWSATADDILSFPVITLFTFLNK
jgi:predicted NAD/FAD-binding protein